jgi:hypothetical protein
MRQQRRLRDQHQHLQDPQVQPQLELSAHLQQYLETQLILPPMEALVLVAAEEVMVRGIVAPHLLQRMEPRLLQPKRREIALLQAHLVALHMYIVKRLPWRFSWHPLFGQSFIKVVMSSLFVHY